MSEEQKITDNVLSIKKSIIIEKNVFFKDNVFFDGIIKSDKGSIKFGSNIEPSGLKLLISNNDSITKIPFINKRGEIIIKDDRYINKNNISEIDRDELYNLLKINPKCFYNSDDEKKIKDYGINPDEIVDKLGKTSLVSFNNNNEPYSVNYDRMIPMLLELIKLLNDKIIYFQTQLQTLETKMGLIDVMTERPVLLPDTCQFWFDQTTNKLKINYLNGCDRQLEISLGDKL